MVSYERMFSLRPMKIRTPLEAADHPELDTTKFGDDKEIKQYQTLIDPLQWLISLVRFDISVHISTLSCFRAQPRKRHVSRAKRIFGYLEWKYDGTIRFRTGEPNCTDMKNQVFEWTRTVYGNVTEIKPYGILEP